MKRTHIFETPPGILASAAIGGKMEADGPMGEYFDKINEDPYLSTDSFEKGESKLQKEAMLHMLNKAGLSEKEIDVVFGGDLLNQCAGTTYGVRELGIPFMGVYGACSTMSESLLLAAAFAAAGYAQKAAAVTSSHFCSAERQYRYPLNYGGQRPPTSQWTATAGGALCVSAESKAPYVRGFTPGMIVDPGITDANNMGAAMAPAAWETIHSFLTDTGLSPKYFDMILTGDLGKVGSRLICELAERDGTYLRDVHRDCGTMLYDFDTQDVHAGGSGCGCSAGVLCGYILPRIRTGEFNNVLFAATGALMSPTTNQQGESIPSISHAVWLSHDLKTQPKK